jgi:hypothetical protein
MFIVEEDLAVQPLIFTITARSSTMNITPLNECETAPNLHNHSKVFNNEHYSLK